MQSNSTKQADLFDSGAMRNCWHCHASKPLSEFATYDNGRGSGPSLKRKCRDCCKSKTGKPHVPLTEKMCRDCKTVKPIESFAKQRTPIGTLTHGSCCKPCRARRMREWLARPGNKDRNRNTRFKKNYGITLAEYNILLVKQGNGCAICGRPEEVYIDPRTNGYRKLAVDHHHHTNQVRGLLCSSCNQGLGHFRDDPKLLRAAADYLDKT